MNTFDDQFVVLQEQEESTRHVRHVSKESFMFFGLGLDIIDDENMVYVSLVIGVKERSSSLIYIRLAYLNLEQHYPNLPHVVFLHPFEYVTILSAFYLHKLKPWLV